MFFLEMFELTLLEYLRYYTIETYRSNSIFKSASHKLFFILTYCKNCSLQENQVLNFGIRQSKAISTSIFLARF